MSYNVMYRFLQNQGFNEYKANFITIYAQEFKMLDILELKDLETKIPSEDLPRFWSGLHGILKKKAILYIDDSVFCLISV